MTLEAYTEKAIALLGAFMPHIAYLPPSLRTRALPATVSTDRTSEAQLDQIMLADPTGFLVAVMHGQIFITFRFEEVGKEASNEAKPTRGRPSTKPRPVSIKLGEKDGLAIYAEYHTPSIPDRMRVAMYLVNLLHSAADDEPPPPIDERHQASIAAALARIEEEAALKESDHALGAGA